MVEHWVDGMLFCAFILGCGVLFCLLGMLGTDRPSERGPIARVALTLLMSYALVPLWPLVGAAAAGWGLVRLIKVADFAAWMDKRSA